MCPSTLIFYSKSPQEHQADELMQMLAAFLLSHNPESALHRRRSHRETRYNDNGVRIRALQGFLQDLTFNGPP